MKTFCRIWSLSRRPLKLLSRCESASFAANNKVIQANTLIIRSFHCSSNWQYKYSSSTLPKESLGSRYHPPSPIEMAEEKIKRLLMDRPTKSLTASEWDDIKTQLLNGTQILSEENLDSVLMNSINFLNDIELAHSYMQYLKEIKVKPNFLTYLKYMVICSKHPDTCGEDIILKTFKKVKSVIDSAPVLDARRVECIVLGLCATSEWRTSFEYLKKLPTTPTVETKNGLACGAARNDDEPLAWEIITKWFYNAELISPLVIKEYVLYLTRLQARSPLQSDSLLLKLFKFLQDNDVTINKATVKVIEKYFTGHRFKWKVDYTKVESNAQCGCCKKQLELLDLTDEEFSVLKQSFFERAVKRSNIFVNTTEKELALYMDFIEYHKPFHIVLDGLNAAHAGDCYKDKKQLAYDLWKIVKMLSKGNKRLLVMGRYHMRRWPRGILEKIEENAKIFFVHNISQDDPFLVYAALSSGPRTLFLSSDLMRDHLSRLQDPKIMLLFRRWQQSHQIYMIEENKSIKFMGPLEHSIKVQGNMEYGWHIPFDDEVILDPYEEINNWLCIQRLDIYPTRL